MNSKKPPLPEGWDPADTPIVRFMKTTHTFDIDGRVLQLTIENKVATITTQFDGKVMWSGVAPSGPFGFEGAAFILDKLEI